MDSQQIHGVSDHTAVNWSQTFSCKPSSFFCPTKEEEIVQILKQAREQNKKVRVIGCGNSPSDISCTDDYMIDMSKMDKLLKVDAANHVVTVQAGVTLKKLSEKYLPNNNLGLSTTGAFSLISLGGAISTGTHGTGIKFGNMATFVLSLDVILATGEKVYCSKEDNPDLFKSICCGIGAIGVILNVEYQCEPAFRMEQQIYPCPFYEVLEHLEVHQNSSEHFRFLWYPHTEHVMVSHINRTQKPPLSLPLVNRLNEWFWSYVIGFYLLEFCYWLSTFSSSFLAPLVNKLFFYLTICRQKHIIDVGHKVLSMECLFKQHVTEWAVPIEKTATTLCKLKEWLEMTPGAFAHFPIEVRFVKEDDFFISPASGQSVCYINIISYRPYGVEIPHKDYWDSYEKIMKSQGGRPHWAKTHPEKFDDFKKMYPKWSQWCEIRNKYDPNRMFFNSYLERIFESN